MPGLLARLAGWLTGRTPASRAAPTGHAAGRNIRARYEGAQTTVENGPLWGLTDYLSARAANSYQVRRTLKIRSRYESANNSYYRGIIDSVSGDLVGTGPRLQVRTGDRKADKQIEAAWHVWASAIGLGEKLRLLAKAKLQDGEAFGLLVTNRTLRATGGGKLQDQGTAQLDLVVVESDQVTTPDPGFGAVQWVDGMVLDRLGYPTEYHVLRQHPGDLMFGQLSPLDYDRWPVPNVCHWFRKDRPGQVRGVPEITPALDLFAELRRYTKAVITAAETAADVAAYVETEAPANTDDETDAPVPWERLPIDRGTLLTLPAGGKIGQVRPEQPATTYEMFVRVLLREICRCINVPLNIAMGDSSGYNYSSGRLDHLSYHRQQKVDRSLCESHVLDKLFASWADEARMVHGLLPASLPAEIPHSWHWQPAESIDPVKDATADQVQLFSGTRTLQMIYAEQGLDWEEVLAQRGAESDRLHELGLPVPGEMPQPRGEPGTGNAGPRIAKVPEAKASARLDIRGYDPDQERAPDGKFGSGGSSPEHEKAAGVLQEKHDAEDLAVDDQRHGEGIDREVAREAEDKAVEKARDKEDTQIGKEENALGKARGKEDAAIEKAGEKLDQTREKEDAQVEKAREREDKAVEGPRDREDAAHEKETAAVEKARSKEDDRLSNQREKEDQAIEDQRELDKDDPAILALTDKEYDAKIADEDKALQGKRDAEDEATQEKRDQEDSARDDVVTDRDLARQSADEATQGKREAEDRALQDARDHEDSVRESDAEQLQEQRDEEDQESSTRAEALQGKRDDEDAARDEAREAEDARIEAEHEAQDQKREEAQEHERQALARQHGASHAPA